YHPAMLVSELQTGSMVIDIDGNRLDARFLRETGAVDDSFTIIKDAALEPLRVAVFTMSNGTVILRWKSIAGKMYQAQRTATLENSSWTAVGSAIAATGATTSLTNSLPAGEARGFYRVTEVAN